MAFNIGVPSLTAAFGAGGNLGAGALAGGAAASGGFGSAVMGALGGPVGIGLMGLQAGLGFMQNQAQNAQRQQDYLNQTAWQDANSQFNQWQASLNRQRTDLNAQFKYWTDTVQYNQNSAYVHQLRGVEFAKELAQAEVVFNTRASAMADYASQSAAISQQYAERGMAEAVAVQQYRYRALQQSAAYQAAGQEGQSMDRFVNNYARQAGDFVALKNLEAGLRDGQFNRAQQGKIAEYMSRYNSQTFYEKQPFMDPVRPFAPLPSMVMPANPSFRGSKPGGTTGLQVAGIGLGALNTGLSFGNSVKDRANS